MKIIQAHNYYQIKGGEDTVVSAEKSMLEAKGHELITFYKRNDEIRDYSALKKINLIKKTTWSKEILVEFTDLLKSTQPDVCHVHNFLPLISPSIFEACAQMNVPVVLTLHNYRLICSNGLFFRNGEVCEDCLCSSAYGSVKKKCYRDSKLQTYAVARMIQQNKKSGTWQNKIDAFICLTDFAKTKFERHGLPANKLLVKPNFISASLLEKQIVEEPYFLFVGRITASKGVDLILKVAQKSNLPIYMIGEGDLVPNFNNKNGIKLLGKKSYAETQKYISNAKALIVPSLWYEGMPMTILEAFSQKTPVIASEIGGIASMINHTKNGLLFEPGSHQSLATQMNYAENNSIELQEISENAFEKFNHLYTKESNYKQLMKIYNKVIEEK